MRHFVLIWVILLTLVVGCEESAKVGGSAVGGQKDVDSVVEYLMAEKPGGLEGIESWESDYGPGLRLITPHYEILTTLMEPLMLRQVPSFIESAYRGYVGQMSEPVEIQTKLTVYLFANRAQWEHFTRKFAGNQAETFCKIKAGAYCHNGSCVVYNIGRKRTFAALGHEGWHQFNSRLFKYRLPSWLDEGVAMLFESSVLADGQFSFQPADNEYRLGSLKKTLDERRAMRLGTLLASNPGEVLASNSSDALLTFYCQSYALVRFLRESSYDQLSGRYQRLLEDGLWGRWPLGENARRMAADRNIPRIVEWNRIVGPELFRYYISEDFEVIERAYFEYCRRIVAE